jgi:hypothetical protein
MLYVFIFFLLSALVQLSLGFLSPVVLEKNTITNSNKWTRTTQRYYMSLPEGAESIPPLSNVFNTDKTFIVLTALSLGIMAQTFIGTMLDGDQGLAAFLSDGKGFNKSAFRPKNNASGTNNGSAVSKDPLPWVKLPKLDFVEVAGQESISEDQIVKQLQELQQLMQRQLESGEKEEATITLKKLNNLMEEYGFEYNENK